MPDTEGPLGGREVKPPLGRKGKQGMSETAREKTLEAVKLILARRGYVVFGIRPDSSVRYEIGHITNICCGHDLGQPFQVISKTDAWDWVEQCQLVNSETRLRISEKAILQAAYGEAFYRAVTD